MAFHRGIYDAARTALKRAYVEAIKLLNTNRASLESLTGALFKTRYLDRTEIADVLAKIPLALHGKAVAPSLQPADSTANRKSSPSTKQVSEAHDGTALTSNSP